MPSPKQSFLSHVAGLRGWAILLVVWFHITGTGAAVPEWASLPYGYFGVEIFIVIMGYFLISGFCRKRDVPLLPFVESKFMRLFVPMAALILMVLAASLFVVDCDELRTMSKTAAAALYGMANDQLIRSTSSYFATDASFNPFLHLWYLSVAVQLFALGYAGYFVLRRFPRRVVITLTAIAAMLSYAYSMASPARLALTALGQPCPWTEGCVSYYATLPRLWELLAGGGVLLLPEVANRTKAGVLSFLGFLMMLLPAFCHGEAAQALSLSVVFGTMLVIRYGAGGLTGALLSNRAMLWLGGISTSLYLVHMPLLVLWKQWTFSQPMLMVSSTLLALSILVGWGFYHAVERRRFTRTAALILWGAALTAALLVSSTKGLKKYWNAELNALELPEYPEFRICTDASVAEGLDSDRLEQEWGWFKLSLPAHHRPKEPEMDFPLVQLGPVNCPARYVLVGDSHAQGIYMGMDKVSRELGISGVYLDSIIEPFRDRECPREFKNYYYNRAKAEAFMHWLKCHPEMQTVVVALRWGKLYERNMDWNQNPVPSTLESNGPALRGFCEDLRAIGKRVVLWGPLPFFDGKKPVTYARWLQRHGYPLHARHPEYICPLSVYNKTFGKVNALFDDLEREGVCRVLRPAQDGDLFHYDAAYGEMVCRAVSNGKFIFKDENHISVFTSLRLTELMKEQLRELLTPTAADFRPTPESTAP